MINKEKLENYASKLMFKMNDKEYETLEKEFDVILKQMDLISKIEGIEKVESMTFPFVTYKVQHRKDEVKNTITTEEALRNAKSKINNQVKVPKVVE